MWNSMLILWENIAIFTSSLHDFHTSFDLKVHMHVKLAMWKACEKHLNKKCGNLVIYFTVFLCVFNNSATRGKRVKQCVKYCLKRMEFSQSPNDAHIYFAWKVNMHIKFALFGRSLIKQWKVYYSNILNYLLLLYHFLFVKEIYT